jgi:hypothetical protein
MTYQSPKVPFTRENIKMCSCGGCPVQAKSKCVEEKIKNIDASLKVQPLQPKDIPLAYCSTGKATCNDLDMHQKCLCPSCPVYQKYSLSKASHVAYYCRDGKAE